LTSIAVALTTFAVILLAELPDKTALASLVLGTRFPPVPVLCGIAAAFTVHVVLAVVAGSLLGLLPHRTLAIVVAVLFIGSALVLVIKRPESGQQAVPERGPKSSWAVAATGFTVILVAEFGDLTQIVIANLVARYQDPIAVGVGADVAMCSIAIGAVLGGRSLLKLVPASLLTRTAAAIMVVLAGFTLAGTFR
jgi:putative Ca2+/H+ antiporter (TMEM165/GDT1 family)